MEKKEQNNKKLSPPKTPAFHKRRGVQQYQHQQEIAKIPSAEKSLLAPQPEPHFEEHNAEKFTTSTKEQVSVAGQLLKKSPSNASPYRQFVAGLSAGDINYLLRESNATVQIVLLQYISRQQRAQILRQMPRQQLVALLRSWANSEQKLAGAALWCAFRWLHHKVAQPYAKVLANADSYTEVDGTKILSLILDALPPAQEQHIIRTMAQNDTNISSRLQNERGSRQQRQILRRVIAKISERELALLFGIPRYGRLLRHLLDGRQKLAILNTSIDLAQLPQEEYHQLRHELLARFPILQKF